MLGTDENAGWRMLRQVATERWTESAALRGAVGRGYMLLRERDPDRLAQLIAAG